MTNNSNKKVGIVSCSGEEIAEGTISRIATRIVMDTLRPGETTTICLPLFLTGGGHEREFAHKFPTITVDGCDKRCAQRATIKYSGAPIGSIVISEVLKKHPSLEINSRDEVGEEGMKAANIIAEEIVNIIDHTITEKD